MVRAMRIDNTHRRKQARGVMEDAIDPSSFEDELRVHDTAWESQRELFHACKAINKDVRRARFGAGGFVTLSHDRQVPV